jgi:hypothetical protein
MMAGWCRFWKGEIRRHDGSVVLGFCSNAGYLGEPARGWSQAYPQSTLPPLVWWRGTGPPGQLVDKSLVRTRSNMYSKSCLKGPTFTVEPDRGAISGTVPGNRTEDRKGVGNGPGGGSTITSNRDCRCASRRTAGSFGRFVVRPTLGHAPRRRLGTRVANPNEEKVRANCFAFGRSVMSDSVVTCRP